MSNDDKKQAEIISALPLRTQEILALLAELDRRTSWQELLWIIESAGNGRYKDLGEVPYGSPSNFLEGRDHEGKDSEHVRVRAFRPAPNPPTSQADAR